MRKVWIETWGFYTTELRSKKAGALTTSERMCSPDLVAR